MLWTIVMLICCLKSVESEECKQQELIIGRLGNFLVFSFQFSDIENKYRNKGIIQNEIEIHDLQMDSVIRFKKKMESEREYTIYKHGSPTQLIGNWTEIFMTNDSFVVKNTELHKEDAGIYWIVFLELSLESKTLIIAGKPTILLGSPPDPVLKLEDNYTSTIQLECDSVSTSIGDCLPTLYIVWYENGMKLGGVDPTLSQINVTVDHNGGNFTCLATDYPPCYQRLQTTKHYDVLNVEECNDVFKSETFYIKPQYAPFKIKLEPDKREITVNKNEDLKVRCSAKCHPRCDVRWEKHFQGLESSGNKFENDLVIEIVNSSYEGIYVCLVNNTYGEVKKNFTLWVRETEDNVLINAEMNIVKVTVPAVIVTVVVVTVIVVAFIIIIKYMKYRKRKKEKLRSLKMRKISEEWKNIVREPRMIKVKMTEDEAMQRIDLRHQNTPLPESKDEDISKTMDVHYDTPLLESRDEAWKKWMIKPWSIEEWKTMF